MFLVVYTKKERTAVKISNIINNTSLLAPLLPNFLTSFIEGSLSPGARKRVEGSTTVSSIINNELSTVSKVKIMRDASHDNCTTFLSNFLIGNLYSTYNAPHKM